MANEEHLRILRQGIKQWNAWRLERPDVRPDLSEAYLSLTDLNLADLSGADLRGADLRGADLRRADLSLTHFYQLDLRQSDLNIQADLSGAALSGADLTRANLRSTNLSGANLSRANLSGVDLSGADLPKADLNGANLSGVYLCETDLREADLSRTTMNFTVFARINLSTVTGLDTVRHTGSSTIGIDTLYLSHGKIPEVFLRGCGVPDALIKNLPLLLSTMQANALGAELFTLNQEEIAEQQKLLTAHRRTLANQLHRLALLGDVHAPPEITHGITVARANIARVKDILRRSGVQVSDHPDDT